MRTENKNTPRQPCQIRAWENVLRSRHWRFCCCPSQTRTSQAPKKGTGEGAGELSPLEEPVDILRRHSRAFSGRNNELGADRAFWQSAELNREDTRSTGRPGRRWTHCCLSSAHKAIRLRSTGLAVSDLGPGSPFRLLPFWKFLW